MMSQDNAVEFYHRAKKQVFEAGFATEYIWQMTRNFEELTERDFLQEYAWVVLSTGFRERIVRDIFPFVSMAFFDFASAKRIVAHGEDCVRVASTRFANAKKLWAIVSTSSVVASVGFKKFKGQVHKNQMLLLQFPFIGAVTIMHLLKNIGVDVAKNDRHLARISSTFGFADATHLCTYLSRCTGDPISAIDIVLWRFSAIGERHRGQASQG